MATSDTNRLAEYAQQPIPTYDEAISTQNQRGPSEISDDAERQGLLPQGSHLSWDQGPGRGGYRVPAFERSRVSEDSDGDLSLPEVAGSGDDERTTVEELDYLDPSAVDPAPTHSRLYHRPRLPSKFSQHLSNLSATLFSIRFPSFRSLYNPIAPAPADNTAAAATATRTSPPSRRTWLNHSLNSIPTLPERYRISVGTAARLCGLASIAVLVYLLFVFDVFTGNARYMGTRFDPESVRVFVQEHVDAGRIEDYLHYITSYDHMAGTKGDLYLAEWMKQKWSEEGGLDEIALLSYYAYLNYPTAGGRGVEIVKPDEKRWAAKLEEENAYPSRAQTFAFHGNSKIGDVEGSLVYANGGSKEDFRWLREQGIVLNGSIALIRSYGVQTQLSLKVKAAEDEGCVGALTYSDPVDGGSAIGAVLPKGPWRPEDSLQRGSVAISSFVIGDPLTPGYASTDDARRVPIEENPGLVQIPSMPLSWRDAKELIKALRGVGKRVPYNWVGGDQDFIREWFSGGVGEEAPLVRLRNLNQENQKQQIWNLHGLIEGLEQPQKKIIVGNHRDAWCLGSVDPGSGSAVLMEVVQIFGQLRKLGWRPLRTIEFISWDAGEYNMIGSTEYAEDNMEYLRENAVAYLNVGAGVYGPDPIFRASGSPIWEKALIHVLDRVSTPRDNSATLKQIWDERQAHLEGLGADGDYAAFQHMAGTSSIDFSFQGAENGFPYHSCYEDFAWMKEFGDPDFAGHRALAQVWALLILEISDRPILPFDLRTYANAIKEPYLQTLQEQADSHWSEIRKGSDDEYHFNLTSLRDAANHFAIAAEEFHRFEDIWTANVLGTGGMENNHFARRRMDYNSRLSTFETDLLDLPDSQKEIRIHGLPGREQFKHVIFGPDTGSRYESMLFPMVRDAIERGNQTDAQIQLEKTAAILKKATNNLNA